MVADQAKGAEPHPLSCDVNGSSLGIPLANYLTYVHVKTLLRFEKIALDTTGN